MNSNSGYYLFAEQHKCELEKAVAIIKQITAPELIYGLGISMQQVKTETLFNEESATAYQVRHIYFVVLVKKEDEHSLNAIQDKIENNLQHFIPSTALVLDINKFRNWLKEGHPFAFYVDHKALKLFVSEEETLPVPTPVDEEVVKKEKEERYQSANAKVKAFTAAAEFFMLRQQYNMAAFMMHQSAEQALLAAMFIKTGLRVNTHNIEKLIRYCSMFCYRLHPLFPKENGKAKRLFKLLNSAYIDTRYRDDYTINCEEAEELMEKVKLIVEVFEGVAGERIKK